MNELSQHTTLVEVIIPFLNEKENIPTLLNAIEDFNALTRDYKLRFVFVDDGSTDGSYEELQKNLPFKNFSAKIIKLSKNVGSHAALRSGIYHSQADFITFMYADMQDPLSIIDLQYKEIQNTESQIVWANRARTENGVFNTLFSRAYAYFMKKYVHASFPSKGFDVVMFGRKVIDQLNQNIEKNSSIFLQILLLGFKQGNIEYNKQERKAGKSKWTFKKKVKLLIDSFVGFSFAPIKLVTNIGIAFFVIGIIWTLYILGRKIMFNDLEMGWASLISILMLGFGITNISIGIIAEYLWRTFDQVTQRPVFIIDKIEIIK